MNKNECKKYIKRAYYRMFSQNKSMTVGNLEIEMKKVINDEADTYIAYGKIAIHNLNKSATEITAKELECQIDVIPKIYTKSQVIEKTKKMLSI